MKILISVLFLIMIIPEIFSQKKDLIYLWPGHVPGETKERNVPVATASQNDNILRLSEVTDPLMQVFLPEQSLKNGSAVIECPGGGYHILAWDLEGTEVAAWLNKNGYAAFVLQYRVPDKKEGALQDVQRAVRLIRKNAAIYGIDPGKIGVMGFSAHCKTPCRTALIAGRRTWLWSAVREFCCRDMAPAC